MEGVDLLGTADAEGNVGAGGGRAVMSVDPEERLRAVLGLLAEAGIALELHQQADPERLQRRFVERLAATEVADLETDVIEHG